MTFEISARQILRKKIRQQRNNLTPEQQHSAAQILCQKLCEHPKIKSAQHISLFLSFDGEIDTRPLIQALWQQNKSLYLPVLHPFSPGHLLFLHYTPETPMISHPFGIQEPRLNVQSVLPVSQLDVIITPLVAFDAQGNRLGMGGGYYDRTLKQWRNNGSWPIGIAHDCQQVEALPCEDWDIPLPEIITPSRDWRW
ncbi:5-formyltetrahydrofolate cyclo-ligase [Budviciaceae bacterium BWR-B9]|uniref:5-formyltetrahydrofolate cyclo-ligase n=1 Tax=Limnobaculum allomyrinae TaxID=2791986 RepID=A0ABS1IRR0_9GAMM|nr:MULTISPECIES: 5-formyltetrahydrofolate cyclo-ligase [Limnobaculum]MBK5144442.1 5-formyltetrahydrofolate cyclo-ligase [Limnobaculum allomyrinae]MBV7692331.1 5-formyltetrahydrofolate cyclo-ligase [Limnobaculum sp. M2-1]